MPPLAPRWSRKTDELVRYVASRCRPSLQSELGHWLEGRPRFRTFVADHQDKIRKKLTNADTEDTRLDVRAELLVAYLVLADRRFDVVFEAYGARQVGPDLSLTFRTNQRLNLEVTRLRTDPAPAKLANVLAAKVRQLPTGVPNALVIVASGLNLDADGLAVAPRLLKTYVDNRDDDFFARRGLTSARDFYALYLRLSGVFALDETTAGRVWFNPETRHPLAGELQTALKACLSTPAS